MAIDAVYKVGIKPEWQGHEELRHSIRSLVQNFKDLGNIFIVGYKPSWCQNVIHIEAGDPYKTNKDANLINKLILACQHPETSRLFLNMSDDQFFLRPTNLEEIVNPRIDNSHINFVPNQKMNRWSTRLKRTVDVLRSRSLTHDCFEAHCPYVLDKTRFPKILMEYDYGFDIGYCGNTIYFNTIRREVNPQMVTSQFRAVYHTPQTVEQIEELTKNSLFLNYTYKAINDGLREFLGKKFSIKTRYEL